MGRSILWHRFNGLVNYIDVGIIASVAISPYVLGFYTFAFLFYHEDEKIGEYRIKRYLRPPRVEVIQDRSSWILKDNDADGTLDVMVEPISDTKYRRRPPTRKEQDLYTMILEKSALSSQHHE